MKIVALLASLLVLIAIFTGLALYRIASRREAVLGQWNVNSEILVGRLMLEPTNDYSMRFEVIGFGFAGFDSAGTWNVHSGIVVLRPASGGKIRFKHLDNPPRLQWINESGGSNLDEFAADMATMKELELIRPSSSGP